ncbi:MAG TPA: TOMM precursor leader peptide-binding protein [Gaiella sp.]|nr:TOMM precursor leader peptide-binding protein [Gaiella sp.]
MDDGDRYLVEQAGTVVTFEGRAVGSLLHRLMPLLDGTRTVEDLENELGPSVAPAIEQALGLLESHRLLVDGPTATETDDALAVTADFAVTVNRRGNRAAAGRAVAAAHVAVLGSGASAAEVARQLGQLGVGRVEPHPIDGVPSTDAFVLAAPCAAEVSALSPINGRALEQGSPWLQLLPFDGRVVVVGPLFVPGTTACRRCYTLRRGACSGYEEDFDLVEEAPMRVRAPLPLVAMGASLAALVTLRWLTTADPALPGRFYSVDVGSILGLSHGHVLRVPRCPECGPPPQAVPAPWFVETT